MSLTLLNLEQPNPSPMRADGYESSAPTGVSLSDIEGMEQFLLGVRTHTGQVVTPEKARRCSAVLACMRGISEDLSALALPLYKRTKDGDVPATDHPVYRILNVAPNDIMTPMELREHMLMDMFLWGGFYNLINEDANGPVSVWPLQAGYVVRRWRELVWTYSDPLTGVSGAFDSNTVWRGTVLAGNGLDGTAITLLAREAIGLALAAEEQAARLFSHGVQSDLVLETTEDTLDDSTRKQLREAFMQRHSGSGNAWMPLLLSGGLTAKRIGLTAQESQYMEARNFQIADIARVFRYPEVLLGSSGKGSKASTYASAEQFFESYTKHTLLPWATRIEQTIHRDLLDEKEQSKYYAKHDFSSLLQANETARIANWNAKIQGGWAQPAEARQAENMPRKDGLDYFIKDASSASDGNPEPQLPDPTPTDQSGLAHRVASLIIRKEITGVAAQKRDADVFYATFGPHVAELTGASPALVTAYLEMRRNDPDRFSTQSQGTAIAALMQLCSTEE
jgi:HK97 family phage portal protein